MNVLIWKQSNNSLNTLNAALQKLAQNYGGVNVIGVINNTWGGVSIELNQSKIFPPNDYDIILVTGAFGAFKFVIENVAALKLDPDKVILDSTICTYDFNLERYKKLRKSKLSIISMNNFGAIIGEIFGLPNSAVNLNFTEENFLKFLHQPLNYLNENLLVRQSNSNFIYSLNDVQFTAGYPNPQITFNALSNWRTNFNPFNTLVVMYTEKPEVLAEFDKLPYAKKVCFVPFETNLDSGYYIKPFYVGGRSFEAAVQKIAGQIYTCFNLWDMLIDCRKTPVNLYSKSLGKEVRAGNSFSSPNGKINFYNWGKKNDYPNFFSRFIENNISDDKTFHIFAGAGDHRFVRTKQVKNKIFVTGEEVFNWPWYDGYQDYCLDSVELALGCEYFDHPKYMRFPFIFWRFLEDKLDKNFISEKVNEINAARSTCKYECCSINSHDMMNTRAPICDRLKDILQIHYAGKWRNNTDELHTVYNDDKLRYVHEFMFNICSENVNRFGYVTEKIFDAFEAGAIPIYYGSDNNPEEGILNKDAVLFWDLKGDNDAVIKEIIRLKTDEDYYEKFMRQEKLFAKNTVEYIYTTLEEMVKRLKEM